MQQILSPVSNVSKPYMVCTCLESSCTESKETNSAHNTLVFLTSATRIYRNTDHLTRVSLKVVSHQWSPELKSLSIKFSHCLQHATDCGVNHLTLQHEFGNLLWYLVSPFWRCRRSTTVAHMLHYLALKETRKVVIVVVTKMVFLAPWYQCGYFRWVKYAQRFRAQSNYTW